MSFGNLRKYAPGLQNESLAFTPQHFEEKLLENISSGVDALGARDTEEADGGPLRTLTSGSSKGKWPFWRLKSAFTLKGWFIFKNDLLSIIETYVLLQILCKPTLFKKIQGNNNNRKLGCIKIVVTSCLVKCQKCILRGIIKGMLEYKALPSRMIYDRVRAMTQIYETGSYPPLTLAEQSCFRMSSWSDPLASHGGCSKVVLKKNNILCNMLNLLKVWSQFFLHFENF